MMRRKNHSKLQKNAPKTIKNCNKLKKIAKMKKMPKNCHFPKNCQKSRPRFSGGTVVYNVQPILMVYTPQNLWYTLSYWDSNCSVIWPLYPQT